MFDKFFFNLENNLRQLGCGNLLVYGNHGCYRYAGFMPEEWERLTKERDYVTHYVSLAHPSLQKAGRAYGYKKKVAGTICDYCGHVELDEEDCE